MPWKSGSNVLGDIWFELCLDSKVLKESSSSGPSDVIEGKRGQYASGYTWLCTIYTVTVSKRQQYKKMKRQKYKEKKNVNGDNI